MQIIFALIMLGCFSATNAQWGYTQDQIEVYDLVDEFKANFYEFLNVAQDASSGEIRRAYRRLSLEMHPDKNKTEGAEENFRLLVAINEVLKNKEQRAIYDEVLVEGIPTAFLYVPKQIRKMGIFEVSVIMALIFTLGHFLVMWGVYLERILVHDDRMERKKSKSLKKKKNTDTNTEESYSHLIKPKLIDILPIAICRGIYYLVKVAPAVYKERREYARLEKLRIEEEKKALEEAKQIEEELRQKREKQKQERKERSRQKHEDRMKMVTRETPKDLKPVFDEPSISYDDLDAFYDEELAQKKSEKAAWTTEEDTKLVKLMTKYPRGTIERWEIIADEMERFKHDVISRAKTAEKVVGMVKATNQTAVIKKAKNLIPEDMDTSVRHDEIVDNENATTASANKDDSQNWSQDEQMLLETALKQHPKKTEEGYDRWELIASMIPDKSKKECVARYKFIAKNLKNKQSKNS